MYRRIMLVCVAAAVSTAALTAPAKLQAQEPTEQDTVEVLPPDHPLRPQPPPRPDIGPLERLGSIIGKTFKLPFEYAGTALEGTLVPIEEERGGFAAGLSAATAGPEERRGHLSFMGGSLGTRSGFLGAGIKFRAFPDPSGPQLGLTAAATNRGYEEHTVFLGWNDPEEHPYVRATGYYDLDSKDQFWGLGRDSDEESESSFSWEKYGGIATAGIPEGESIVWGNAYVTYETTSVFRGREIGEPDLIDLFPEVLFSDLEIWGPGATLALDFRDSPGYPRKGVLLRGTGEMWRSAGDDELEWFRYAGEASGHIPLGGWHVFSVKAGVDVAEPEKGEIPFTYLPTLGGSQILRGYSGWRWRDEATAYGTAELRWRIWLEHTRDPERAGALETAIFYDVGDVAEELDELEWSERKTSYGLIVRFYLLGGHVMTLGAGHSDEVTRFVFTTNNSW